MPRYYFDLRDDRGLFPDEEGLELPTIDAARAEAAQALADMLRDAVQDDSRTLHLSIEVRNDVGRVLHLKSSFEIETLV